MITFKFILHNFILYRTYIIKGAVGDLGNANISLLALKTYYHSSLQIAVQSNASSKTHERTHTQLLSAKHHKRWRLPHVSKHISLQ